MLDYFHVPRVDQEELLVILLEHFNRAEWRGNRLRFHRADSPEQYLEVAFDDGDLIAAIELTPEVAVDRETIRGRVENALVRDQYPALGQRVGFCSQQVSGCFRYRDSFQLVPVPRDAPRPTFLMADHPFLLQFSYTASPQMTIRHMRADRQARQYFRLLNLLVSARIHQGGRYGRWFWVLHADANPEDWTCAWEQRGYTYRGNSGEIPEYSSGVDFVPIELRPAADYHTTAFGAVGDALVLPDDIGASLDAAIGLRSDDWARFQRAIAYYDLAQTVSWDSNSLAYIALVTAVEALVGDPERCPTCRQPAADAVERCATCGLPRFRVMRHFREFLEEHAPFPSDQLWARDLLYGMRSDLAHGRDVMDRDLRPLSMFSLQAMSEDVLSNAVHRMAGTAIRSWLRSRRQPAA